MSGPRSGRASPQLPGSSAMTAPIAEKAILRHDLVERARWCTIWKLLLGKAGLSPPYILVGHSFGGLLVRLFANRRTDDVAGLVLVDSMSDQQFDIFGRMFPPPTPLDPLELQKTRAFWTGGWRDSNSTQEGIDFPVSLAEGRAVTTLGEHSDFGYSTQVRFLTSHWYRRLFGVCCRSVGMICRLISSPYPTALPSSERREAVISSNVTILIS